MIEFITNNNNNNAAREIWINCFGDTRQYTDFLFDRLVRSENVLLCNADKVPAAMLCFEPFTMSTPDGDFDAAYVFGVATLPEWRNRGLSKSLLAELERRLVKQGVAMIALVPAGPRLFEFYARQHYETAFFVQKEIRQAADIRSGSGCRLKPVALDSLEDFRNRFYSGRSLFVRWQEKYLAYIDSEANALGGGTFAVETDEGREGYVVCYPYKTMVIVKELAVPCRRIEETLSALHVRFQASEYRLHLPNDVETSVRTESQPFAMIKYIDRDVEKTIRSSMDRTQSKPAYIAHVLDGPTLGVPLQEV